jgi:hypothetical protein
VAPGSARERAEEAVDAAAAATARLFSTCGRWLLRAAAHVRESAEDFWAEVQSRRRDKR